MSRVSIIMGVYNCASTLKEAIDSLYDQTFQDFDVIICDDGSSDETYSVAERYTERFNNIVLLKNSVNQGLNSTLNRCLDVATGDYIARMDGDDISAPLRLEIEVNFLDSHPEYAIVSAPMYYFDENGVFAKGAGNGEPRLRDFAKGTPFCHAPCMIRREAYEKVGGYTTDKRLLRVEDYHLWIKMYSEGYKGYMLEEPLYYMRDDRNAAQRRSWNNRINEVYVRHLAIHDLGLPTYNYIHCLKPVLLALLPTSVYSWLHKKRISL